MPLRVEAQASAAQTLATGGAVNYDVVSRNSDNAVTTGAGGPYKVFTPFFRALMQTAEAPSPTAAPRAIETPKTIGGDRIDDWDLHPRRPD